MKRLFLIGVLVISGLSYARDFDYREKMELESVRETSIVIPARMNRERYLTGDSKEKYAEFHRELDDMNKYSNRDR